MVEAEFEECVGRRMGRGIWGGECGSHVKPGGESAKVEGSGLGRNGGGGEGRRYGIWGMGRKSSKGKINGCGRDCRVGENRGGGEDDGGGI